MSPILLGLAIDWDKLKTTNNNQLGIKWVDDNTLENLDFAEEMPLLNSSHLDIRTEGGGGGGGVASRTSHND